MLSGQRFESQGARAGANRNSAAHVCNGSQTISLFHNLELRPMAWRRDTSIARHRSASHAFSHLFGALFRHCRVR